MQQCGFLYQSGAGQLVDQRFSMFKCRSDPPDAGNLGGMVKLALAQLVDQRFSMFKCRSDPPDAGNLGGMVKLKPAPPSKNKDTNVMYISAEKLTIH